MNESEETENTNNGTRKKQSLALQSCHEVKKREGKAMPGVAKAFLSVAESCVVAGGWGVTCKHKQTTMVVQNGCGVCPSKRFFRLFLSTVSI
mmetsp:Transcript_12448/g.29959  ORF Transcript_12448/g.29959 Transcript_12448/m.29959 type:complete len:92 (+) Transcript_12448:33-308(+)